MPASEKLNQKNILALAQNEKQMYLKVEALLERVAILEKNMSVLHAEVASHKQLVGHMLGRGMGSTTE